MNRSTFPTTIMGFAGYLGTLLPYLTTNATRLGITPAQLAIITALYGDSTTSGTYLYYYTLWSDLTGGRTRKVMANLALVSKQMKALLTKAFDDIPASVWTEDDRKTCNRKTGLPHKPTKPTTPIKEICIVDIEVRTNGLFYFGIRQRDDTKRYNIPEDGDAAEIVYAIVESKYRVADSELASKVRKKCEGPNDGTTKEIFFSAKFNLAIDPLLKAFDLVCWVRWTNTRHPNLAGEWSGPHIKTIL